MFTDVDYRSHLTGLADCNNFYASCERVFRPDLRNVPVAVLSNNDGCVIARSKELKDLGVKMGVPYFQIKPLERQHRIAVFSSNYELYGDMSNRVMSALAGFVPETEIYSIDECFLNFSGMERFDLAEYGRRIVSEVSNGTGIPISLGIAPTKTLAKVANKFAKKYAGYKGSCLIDSSEKHIKALQLTEIGDIWGVGRRHEKRLNRYGIKTAYDLIMMPREWIRQELTVVGEKMWKELRGIPCIDMEIEAPPKKSICTSRAFGQVATNIEQLKEAVANFASLCAAKLRKQHSCTSTVMVFIHTNNFNPNVPQYARNIIVKLPTPSSITPEIVGYALRGLEKIFKPGYEYKKAGVIIMETSPDNTIQQNMFDTYDRDRHSKIMPIVDQLNSGFNRNLLVLGSQIGKHTWKMKQERRSPCYTTRTSDFIRVKLR